MGEKTKQGKNQDSEVEVKETVMSLNYCSNDCINDCIVVLTPPGLISTVILVRDYDQHLHECRALLDSGSQSNFITREFNKLRIKKLNQANVDTTVTGINSIPIEAMQQTCATIKSNE